MSDNTQVHNELLALTADIVSSHFANNTVSPGDVPGVIEAVYATLSKLGVPQEAPVTRQEPAVSVRASIKPDYIVCLEDGKKLKMLKRHLMTRYGMTPDQYRTKWGLPADYPMVAPNYAEQRRTLAKSIGLGTKRVGKVGGKPRGRPRKNPVAAA
ncbi:transcriptional regulator [alpha proteobacterium AAP81b]|nr:transcriptional regulator [alpha proteobacterium AAP81b]